MAQNAIALNNDPRQVRRTCFQADANVHVNWPNMRRAAIDQPWLNTQPKQARTAPTMNANRPYPIEEDEDGAATPCSGDSPDEK